MKKTQLKQWQRNGLEFFNSSRRKVFKHRDFASIIAEERVGLGIPSSTTVTRFVEFLGQRGHLQKVVVARETDKPEPTDSEGRRTGDVTRYVWGSASPYSLALSLRPKSYLSHASALFLQGLTDQIPKTIYVNKEQSPKPTTSRSDLSQDAMDRAFQRPPRRSRYVYSWEGFKVVLISGKNTQRLEVTQIDGPDGDILDVTKVERTLIDATVRPFYAGGVFQVLEAFRAARERLSVNTLVATLRKLNYAYPYHQAVGFYMEHAGYEQKQLDKMSSLGIEFDFYLSYGMGDTDYSSKWHLHYPQGLR